MRATASTLAWLVMLWLGSAAAAHLGAHTLHHHVRASPDADAIASFSVFLKLRDDGVELERLVSRAADVKHREYSRFLTLSALRGLHGPAQHAADAVRNWLESGDCSGAQSLRSLRVEIAASGDILSVSGQISAIEARFQTKLALVGRGVSNPRLLVRSISALSVPDCAASHVAFFSLNAPLHSVTPRSGRELSRRSATSTASVSVEPGQDVAALTFIAFCRMNLGGAGEGGAGEGGAGEGGAGEGGAGEGAGVRSQADDACGPQARVGSLVARVIYADEPNLPSMKFPLDSLSRCVPAGVSGELRCSALLAPLPRHRKLIVHVEQHIASAEGTGQNWVHKSAPFFQMELTTPTLLRELYSVPRGSKVRHRSSNAVAEFLGEYYSDADLSTFFANIGEPRKIIPEERVIGSAPNNQTHPGGEGQLDVAYMLALAPGAKSYYYSFSEVNPYSPENEGFLAWLITLNNDPLPPLVQSVSYGDDEGSVFNTSVRGATEYARRIDLEFAKLAARGVSVVVASGDDGASGVLARTDRAACKAAHPEWPASSPWVTSVGATQLSDRYAPLCSATYSSVRGSALPIGCSGRGEVACSAALGGIITSGGGFSNVYPRPTWQEDAVATYLSGRTAPPASFFNPTGRGYPDVAAIGSQYCAARPRTRACVCACACCSSSAAAPGHPSCPPPASRCGRCPPEGESHTREWHECIHTGHETPHPPHRVGTTPCPPICVAAYHRVDAAPTAPLISLAYPHPQTRAYHVHDRIHAPCTGAGGAGDAAQ